MELSQPVHLIKVMEARISSLMKLLKFKQLGEYMSQVHIKDEKHMKNEK